MPKSRTMRLITVHLPEWMLEAMDEAVKRMGLYTRSDFIRYAIREMLTEVLHGEDSHR